MYFFCVCVETALLLACSAKVLMIADGVCLNLLFMFPEQNMLQIGNLPYVMNDVMHRQPLLLGAVSTAGIKGFLFSLCRIQKNP